MAMRIEFTHQGTRRATKQKGQRASTCSDDEVVLTPLSPKAEIVSSYSCIHRTFVLLMHCFKKGKTRVSS